MPPLHTEITIDTPPERVWAVLTDFAAYPEWNPFVVSIAGAVDEGASLRVRIRPPGGRATTLKPVVTEAIAPEVFEWRGTLRIPGLFSGRHRFELHRTASGGTRLVQGETFTGVLVPLLGGLLKRTATGFAAMNEALKARAENTVVQR